MNFTKQSQNADRICIFLIGFLICLYAAFTLQDNFEKNFFKGLAENIRSKQRNTNEDSSIISALHITNKLLSERALAFKGQAELTGNIYAGSLTSDLMTADGACGSYANVLANLLQTMGFKTRILQMQVNGSYGGHIITEVETKKGWVVLDALYDLYFVSPLGTLASFAAVSKNWTYYKRQTPAAYDKNYRYEGVRYTNWTKIPVLMPLIKKGIILFEGTEKAETFSIRPLFLRKYKVYSLLLIPLILMLVYQLIKNKPAFSKISTFKTLSGWNRYIIGWHILYYSKAKRNYYLPFANEVYLQPLLTYGKNHARDALETPTEISALHIPFNSAFGILKRKLGFPKYSIRTLYGRVPHEIYFYTIDVHGKKTVMQFHYFSEKFFLCNMTFINTDKDEKDFILGALAQKYSIETSNSDRIISVDKEGNLLMCDNSVNLNISYMSNNTETISLLSEEMRPVNKMDTPAYRAAKLSLLEIL